MTRGPIISSPQQPANDAQWAHPMRVADLAQRKATRFSLVPTETVLKAIAADLGIVGLKKVRFEGKLSPVGKSDWLLEAVLGATVIQTCVVSLASVNTRLDSPVEREFIADKSSFEVVLDDNEEVEIDADDAREPLGSVIDLGSVLHESLALVLPLYPRAQDAVLKKAQFAAPDTTPMQDEDARPFAGLANLLNTGDKPDNE